MEGLQDFDFSRDVDWFSKHNILSNLHEGLLTGVHEAKISKENLLQLVHFQSYVDLIVSVFQIFLVLRQKVQSWNIGDYAIRIRPDSSLHHIQPERIVFIVLNCKPVVQKQEGIRSLSVAVKSLISFLHRVVVSINHGKVVIIKILFVVIVKFLIKILSLCVFLLLRR